MLDVGTNREELLGDPMYVGNRHPRIRGDRYAEFLDLYVKTVRRLYPRAVLIWEDLAPENGRRILARYRDAMCTFNDDIQGTGAIALAAAISAIRVCGTTMRSQRVVIFGAGTAGVGVADKLTKAMIREGLSRAEATGRFWCVDRQGLLTSDMSDLHDHQAPYARPPSESRDWIRSCQPSGVDLAEVVRRVKPTMLVGSSGVGGAFNEAVIRSMASYTERPIIFPLSQPAARSEANPTDLIAWTDGRALIGTGTAFTPVTYKGTTYVVGQISNAMLFPGLVLGTIVSRASKISDGMFAAASAAVSSLVTVRQPGASLLPNINDLRAVAMTVAGAVVEAAFHEGLAQGKVGDIGRAVQEAMWQPKYHPLLAV
jgi:malate dehydrogenase (oxaloacetate-decarboxylating)